MMQKSMTDRESRSSLSLFTAAALIAGATAAAMYAVRRQRRTDFAHKNVLIAGASRGLGLELAREFAKEGANLILLARDEEQLTAVKRELENGGRQV